MYIYTKRFLRKISKIVLVVFISFQFFYSFLFGQAVAPVSAQTMTFYQAYTTMQNSRFSFLGSVAAAGTGASNSVTIASSGNADNNTGNLFKDDRVCFNASNSYGCINTLSATYGNGNYTVENVPSPSGQYFVFSPSVGTSGTAAFNVNDRVVATQSGQLTISFNPNTPLVVGDKIVIDVPAAGSSSTDSDGIPDSGGFDSAALPADLINGTGCAGSTCLVLGNFTVSAAALTQDTLKHTITLTLSSAVGATSPVYTIGIGNTSSGSAVRFLNPAPSGTSHVRGVSDSYTIRIRSQNSAGSITYDDTNMKVNPIDGVFVSATVEESLTYKINEASSTWIDGSGNLIAGTNVTTCNGGTFTTSVASTPTTINFGSITSFDTFYRAAQTLYVQTNSANGYVVTAQYNNALQTDGATQTIADGTCDGACTADTGNAWATATNNGFGYNLGNILGTDAYTGGTGSNFRIFANTAKTIMSKSSQTSGSRIAICYQLSVDATQATGYYYNKLTYIATPKF